MADYTSHAPGTFCWPELSTTDQKAAVSFYRALFGWDVNDTPLGPDEVYSTFQLRGKSVGAAYNQQPEERQHNVPPHWNSYVSVASADEAAKKAESLGAKTLMAGVRCDGFRADGGDPGSDRGGVSGVGAEETHRRAGSP